MTEGSPQKGSWMRSRSGLVLIAFLAIAAFFVIAEHTAHVLGILPYLLLLACPLLHWFHGGHGGHTGHGASKGNGAQRGRGDVP